MQKAFYSVLVRRPIIAAAICVSSVILAGALATVLQSFHDRTVVSALPPARSAAHAATPRPSYWHTSGSTIRDSGNHIVRIAGLNWSGLETTHAVPGGLTTRDYRAILRSVAAGGYNTIRLPFSNQAVEAPIRPSAIAFQGAYGPMNQDLVGLDSLEIMDRIIAAAGEAGLRVILDNHRSEAGSSAQESGLWYTPAYPENRWITDWTFLAARYRNNPTVVGVDLRNEPHNSTSGGACWGCGGARDWRLAAERAGNAVLRVNPALLVFVEGTDTVDGQGYWWGGNLAGVRSAPVRLTLPNRLVYSPHDYGPTEYQQPWFNASTTPAVLSSLWQAHWAFIADENLAPLFLGEFGATNDAAALASNDSGSEGQWFRTLVTFLNTHSSIGWAYWGLNGEDRYALLDSNYTFRTANRQKFEALSSLFRKPLHVEEWNQARAQPEAAFVGQRRTTSTKSEDVAAAIAAQVRFAVLRTSSLPPPQLSAVYCRCNRSDAGRRRPLLQVSAAVQTRWSYQSP